MGEVAATMPPNMHPQMYLNVIARVVFNFPLNAQTQGSSYFNDLREMIRLTESQFSWNPLVKISTFVKRRIVLGRLHPSIISKIRERLSLLRNEKIIPSRTN